MKKIFTLIASLMMVLSMNAATKTIYCKMAQSWWKADGAAVGAYYWEPQSAPAWPGVRMTPVTGETDLWSVDIDTDKYTKIIFTRVNGSGTVSDWGAKTGDQTIPTDDKNLFTITSSSAVWGDPGCVGEWSTYTPAATPEPEPEPEPVADVTVHFINSVEWAAVACHHWIPDGAGTSWPGDVLSKTDEIAGYDVYTATFTGAHTSCIFNNNNNGQQTGDLTVENGKYYEANTQTWYADKAAAEAALATPIPDETVYLINTGNWSKAMIHTWNGVGGTTWPGVEMTLTGETIEEYAVYSYTAKQGGQANLLFQESENVNKTGDLTWEAGKYYAPLKNEWYDTKEAAAEALAAPVEYEYVYLINTNDWAAAHIYTWTPEVAGWPGAAMTLEAEQIAGKDVYSYKVVKGTTFGGLNFNCGSDECKTGDLTWQAGKYYAPSKNDWYDDAAAAEAALNTPAVITYALMGVGGDWTTGITMTYNEENNQYVLTNQAISKATDAVKVAKLSDGSPVEWYNTVDSYSCAHEIDESNNNNIVLEDGTYDFYFKLSNNEIYIEKDDQITHDVYAEGVTVSEGGWSINLSGSWNDQSFTVMLWQDNTQGFGTYAANAETGYSAQLGVKELTPTAEGYYTDMMDGTFTFQGTMTDGTDIYEVFLKGALESSTPETGEMEAKSEVYFTCQDGEWTIEAMADDYSWMLALAVTLDDMTGEYIATGEYTYYTDIENDETATEEVSGTGLLYFDDFSGCQVFRGTLTTESGEIYPTLYASSLTLMTNDLMTGESWVGNFAGVDYYEVMLYAADYSWELDLHARNCTGANGTYTIDVVDEEEGAYSTFMGNTIVTGELNIEGGMYDAYVYTKDAEGNDAMYINATGLKLASVETVINIDDATVIEDLSQYGSSWSMKGEVELEGTTYPVTVEIADEVDLTVPSAEVYLSVTVEELGFVDGNATLTINGNTMAVEGELENEYAGVKFVFDISGTLPTCPNIRLQAGNNAALLEAVHGKQVNVTVGRNFEAGDGFYTLCVPFSMPASVIGKAYQIATITEAAEGGMNVEFTEVTTILAGQPYLIEPATDLDGFTVDAVTIDNSTPAAVTVSGEGVSITMQGKYSRDAKTNGLYWVGNDGYLYNDDVWPTALCAYFNIVTPSGIAPRMRVVTKEDAETGLDNITTGTKAVKAIENGQLIIIRDGVNYNVQGQKL